MRILFDPFQGFLVSGRENDLGTTDSTPPIFSYEWGYELSRWV
jgi:hypothetical protein